MMAHAYAPLSVMDRSPVLTGFWLFSGLVAMAFFGLNLDWVLYWDYRVPAQALASIGISPPETMAGFWGLAAVYALLTIPVGLVLGWMLVGSRMFREVLELETAGFLHFGATFASVGLVLLSLEGEPILLAPAAVYFAFLAARVFMR